MAFFSEIFFSTLIGKPVYSVDEKYFGDFRDFIVKRQNGSFLVTKVRIRVHGGKRVIVPWSDVHSIEADPISLKLRRKIHEIKPIDYDDDELRLKRDFLDQQIIDTDAHRVVRVNDIKIVAVKDELFMVAADIGTRGLFRRIGLEWFLLWITKLFNISPSNAFIPSQYIDPLPARIRHDITLTVAQDQLKNMHPADLADIMADLDHFERSSIMQALPMEMVAKILAELDPSMRKELLGKLKDETVTNLMERLNPGDAKDILSKLPKRRMHHVLNAMKATEAAEIKGLLAFKEDTAGSIMNPEFVAFQATLTAELALAELRKKSPKAEKIFYLYIIDDSCALKGVISLRDLIFVEPSAQLFTLIKRKPICVKSTDHINEVVEKFTKYGIIAMPVLEKNRKLVGVITIDDVLPLLGGPLK